MEREREREMKAVLVPDMSFNYSLQLLFFHVMFACSLQVQQGERKLYLFDLQTDHPYTP